MQFDGSLLYLAGYQGLHIVNISNSTNATRLGGWKRSTTNLTYTALAVSWPYVHLACANEGFNIVHAGNPANCVRVGGYVDAGFPVNDVALLGPYALLLNSARREIRVLDVSNPTNSTYITSIATKGPTRNINVIDGELFLANGIEGLKIIPAIQDIHHTLRIDASPNLAFTLEAATNLSDPNSWQPLLTTNVATMPFDFVDFDVKLADKPHKFYRVRQP